MALILPRKALSAYDKRLAELEGKDVYKRQFIRYGDAIDVRGGNYCRFSPREEK